MSIRPLFLICVLLAAGCSRQNWKVEEISSPAGGNSSVPYLRAADDTVWMSWMEQANQTATLKSAAWNNGWTNPQTVTSGKNLFVNWADFPSILPMSNGTLAVHWLQKRGADKYAYDVMSSLSKDHGATWSQPLRVHQDQTETEHGFASLAQTDSNAFSIVWLDGRNFKTGGPMSLMTATYRENQFEKELSIDSSVCDCCQTGVARIPGGLFVIYRDRTEAEIRDIYYIRSINGKWSSPKAIHPDGWKIHGCPVNGPAVSSSGMNIAVAWYTAANDQPRAYAAFSKDAGESFTSPIRIDSGNPAGQVDIEIFNDGSAMVSWMETQKENNLDIRMRNVFPDGKLSSPIVVADAAKARANGVPRIARSGKNILIAWTSGSNPTRIRVAKIFR